jgi:glyceraldehyde 3-phosphate dehydrogenase
MIRIGINGFGRIGRLAFRNIVFNANCEVVAINDLVSVEQLAYLLKYDSAHGRFKGTVAVESGNLVVNNKAIRISAEKNPENIAWGALDVDYVIESTGFFTDKNLAGLHLNTGAKRVVISAPSANAPMFVMGVNHKNLSPNDLVFSNASCTTNCIAPVAKVLLENFGIEEAFATTVHAATSSQKTVDGEEKLWRRGRSALNNMIPTTTNAAIATVKILPQLEGKLMAMAVRVPTVDVSLVDLTVKLSKPTSYNKIKAVMKQASEGNLNGILGYTEDEVVSQDFISEKRTAVFDAAAGMELNANFFKLIIWYDNEFGYASKLVDLIEYSNSISG